MSIAEILSEYWWVFLLLIPMLYLMYKRDKKEKVGKYSFEQITIIIKFISFIIIIYLIEHYIFNEHNFFTVALPIFVIVLSAFIYIILMRNNRYILCTTFQNQIFYDMKNKKKIISPNSNHQLYVMDSSVYEAIDHVGDLNYRFWKGTEKIGFCDYLDEKEHIAYHPRINEIHNITFYTCKAFWIKLRNDLPKLIDENIKLSWLSEWRLAVKFDSMKKSFAEALPSISKQHEHTPFEIEDDMDKLYEQLKDEQYKDTAEHEKPIKIEGDESE